MDEWIAECEEDPLSKYKKFDADDKQYSGADGTISTFVQNIKHITAIYAQRLEQQERHAETQAINQVMSLKAENFEAFETQQRNNMLAVQKGTAKACV